MADAVTAFFSSKFYPRAALDEAAEAFAGVAAAAIEDAPGGCRVRLTPVEGAEAGERSDLAGEFANYALEAALEKIHGDAHPAAPV
ncbi:MAG: hypothetical protein HY719_09265 [Planctomycetes bacterium]|nr:hypothetical protein [Planctomycetota bacterium]